MVDIKCKFGERVAIGKQEFVEVIKVMPEGVVLRLTTVNEPLDRAAESTIEDREWQFLHSE